jgi:UDP-N-acetylmuramyl pentapeptide phosphotransferase/UDP-N-acetylglucosamine-1-phosphate transferase
LLGVLAVVARQELLLLVVGAVFVAEAVSVIVQVAYYKWRRRRLLRCAPLHHHFQFLGWAENKIVVRFWIASALCALAGLASLRLSVADVAAPTMVTDCQVDNCRVDNSTCQTPRDCGPGDQSAI